MLLLADTTVQLLNLGLINWAVQVTYFDAKRFNFIVLLVRLLIFLHDHQWSF